MNSDIICRQAVSRLQTPPKVGALLVVGGAWHGAGLGSTLQCQWSAGSEQWWWWWWWGGCGLSSWRRPASCLLAWGWTSGPTGPGQAGPCRTCPGSPSLTGRSTTHINNIFHFFKIQIMLKSNLVFKLTFLLSTWSGGRGRGKWFIYWLLPPHCHVHGALPVTP